MCALFLSLNKYLCSKICLQLLAILEFPLCFPECMKLTHNFTHLLVFTASFCVIINRPVYQISKTTENSIISVVVYLPIKRFLCVHACLLCRCTCTNYLRICKTNRLRLCGCVCVSMWVCISVRTCEFTCVIYANLKEGCCC